MKNITLTNPISLKIINNTGFKNIASNSLDILFNIEGITSVSLNGNIFIMKKYDIILINQFESYEIFKTKEAYSLFIIRINRSLLNLSEDVLNAKFSCNSCDYKSKERFSSIHSLIYDYLNKFDNISFFQSVSISYSFYDELLKNFKKNIENSKNNEFEEILNYIEINYDQDLMLKELANEYHLSIPYLSKRFKEVTGLNFNDYYDKIRIAHANYDLYETDIPIIDIAYKHGFSSAQAYLRSFKKINGILPSEARKKKTDVIIEDNSSSTSIFKKIINNYQNNTLKTKPYKTINLTLKNNQTLLMKTKNVSNKVIGIGPAKLLLYKNIQDILVFLQRDVSFQYAHIKGLFSDDFSFVTRNENNTLIFNFSLLNSVLDFLDSINLYPMINLVYLSNVIASNTKKNIFSKNYNVSFPRSLEEWRILLKTSITYFIKRYGIEKVNKWIFIPWVTPEATSFQFNPNDEYEFYEYYKNTYQAIKEISPDIVVASPEFFPITNKNEDYMLRFLNYAKTNNCFPDFLSLMFYADDKIDELFEVQLDTYNYHKSTTAMSTDEKLMNRYLRNLLLSLENNSFNIPLWITEFNYTITHKNLLLDTLFFPNFIVKNYLDNMHLINSLGIWHLSDYEDNLIHKGLFYGGSGLFLGNNLAKPAAGIFNFLTRLGDEIIIKGENYVISRYSNRPNNYYIILYNYDNPSKNALSFDIEDRYSVFTKTERNKFKISISNLSYESAFLREFSINRYHGNPYDRWLLMGKPETDIYNKNFNVIDQILEASRLPDYKEENINIINGVLNYEINVDTLEIKGIDILLK